MSVESIKVADLIVDEKATFAAFSFAAMLIGGLNYELLGYAEKRMNSKLDIVGMIKKHNISSDINDIQTVNDEYKLNIRNSIDYMVSNKLTDKFIDDILKDIIITIAHELKANKYFDKSPELECLRHIRNGLAHGNRFYFERGEPKRPASFKQMIITNQLQGIVVLPEKQSNGFLEVGDIMELLDFLEQKLRTL